MCSFARGQQPWAIEHSELFPASREKSSDILSDRSVKCVLECEYVCGICGLDPIKFNFTWILTIIVHFQSYLLSTCIRNFAIELKPTCLKRQ